MGARRVGVALRPAGRWGLVAQLTLLLLACGRVDPLGRSRQHSPPDGAGGRKDASPPPVPSVDAAVDALLPDSAPPGPRTATWGDAGAEWALDVLVNRGTVFVTGQRAETLEPTWIDLGGSRTGPIEAEAGGNYVLVALDEDLRYRWARPLPGSGAGSIRVELAPAPDGGAYVASHYAGGTPLGAGPPPASHTTYGSYVSRYSAAGERLWTRVLPTTSSSADNPRVDAASSGPSVFFCAAFSGPLTFDIAGQPATLTPAGLEDVVVLKLGANGDPEWARSVGLADSRMVCDSVAVLADGSVAVAGSHGGLTGLDGAVSPEPAQHNFVRVFDPRGAVRFTWTTNVVLPPLTTYSTPQTHVAAHGTAVIVAAKPATPILELPPLLLAGLGLQGEFLFQRGFSEDPGAFVSRPRSIGGSAWLAMTGTDGITIDGAHAPLQSQGAVLVEVDDAGVVHVRAVLDGPERDRIHGIARLSSGELLLGGTFEATLDFDPGPGTDPRTSRGYGDAFLTTRDLGDGEQL